MKYFVSFLIVFYIASFNNYCFGDGNRKTMIRELLLSEQGPFDFFNPVPAKIKTNERIDLSFSVYNSIVYQYRYRLEVPTGAIASINKTLLNWSAWISNAFTDIIIPKLEQEGSYKLIIEYKTQASSEIKKFEKSFDVYKETLSTNAVNGKSKPESKITNTSANVNGKQSLAEKSIIPDYSKLLAEAIEKKDSSMARKAILNGAGSDIKGVNGGNIFHLINESIATKELIGLLKNRGISIDETDNFGNTPLHIAIMFRDDLYARSLISQGANLNLKNKVELSPLHLAAFLDDKEIVKDLLNSGAEANLKGNSGYTPLHIASLLNHFDIASDLLKNGAINRIKTDQKLTPRTIAKIQNNHEIVKLIGKNGSYILKPRKSDIINSTSQMTSVKLNPQFDINLLYNKKLLHKRKFNKITQIISIPIFALSAAGTTFMKIEADNYYSQYKKAELPEQAEHYYNKTKQYDTYTYISGTVSLVSVFGFIHSTIRKKSISNKMCKTLY